MLYQHVSLSNINFIIGCISQTETNLTLQCGWTAHLIHTTVSTDPMLSQESVCNVYLYLNCP